MVHTDPKTPIIIMTNCESVNEAKKIGRFVLEKRLAACFNIIPSITSLYFWPPESDIFEENNEVSLMLKTFSSHYARVEAAIMQNSTYITPFIGAIAFSHMSPKYLAWLQAEIRG